MTVNLNRIERKRRARIILRNVSEYVTLHDPFVQERNGEATEQSWDRLLQARAELEALIRAERAQGGAAWAAFVARRVVPGRRKT
jgi:hypothetical protein